MESQRRRLIFKVKTRRVKNACYIFRHKFRHKFCLGLVWLIIGSFSPYDGFFYTFPSTPSWSPLCFPWSPSPS